MGFFVILAATFIGRSGYLGTHAAASFFSLLFASNSMPWFLLRLENVPTALSILSRNKERIRRENFQGRNTSWR